MIILPPPSEGRTAHSGRLRRSSSLHTRRGTPIRRAALRIGALLVFCTGWLLAGPAAANDSFPSDPREIEANALLTDEATWKRAAELYREVLADDPANDGARMWLCRVLAWDGAFDEALAHYDDFLARSDPPDWVEVERAEVLSWAARYDDAERAFETLLDREPDNERAMLGLARNLRWAGRPAKADTAYAQAIEMGAGGDAERELAELRSGLGWKLTSDSDFYGDNYDYTRATVEARGSRGLGYVSRLFARSSFTRIAAASGAGLPDGASTVLHGVDAVLGFERELPLGFRTSMEAGARRWNDAGDRFLAAAQVEYSAPFGSAFTLSVDFGDFLKRSDSFDAVVAGLYATSARLSVWQPLTRRVAGFVSAESSFVSDSNQRIATGASVDFRPWERHDVVFVVGASYVGYTDSSNLYYAPTSDTAATFGLRVRQLLATNLDVLLDADAGVGFVREKGVDGVGPSIAISGGPHWQRPGGLSISVLGRYSLSQRSAVYTSFGASMNVGMAF